MRISDWSADVGSSDLNLLELMAEIMGSAPQLADRLNRNPHLLEAVLAPDFFDPIPPAEALEAELQVALSDAQDLQDVLEQTRRWANDRRSQVGVHIPRHKSAVDASGRAHSETGSGTGRERVCQSVSHWV